MFSRYVIIVISASFVISLLNKNKVNNLQNQPFDSLQSITFVTILVLNCNVVRKGGVKTIKNN